MSLAPLASRYLPSSLTSQLPSMPAFGRSASAAGTLQRQAPSEREEVLIPPAPGYASRGGGADPRSSTLLPSITCSSCGIGLRMEELGEHICDGNGGEAAGDAGSQNREQGSQSWNQNVRSHARSGSTTHHPAAHIGSHEFSRSRNRSHDPSPTAPSLRCADPSDRKLHDPYGRSPSTAIGRAPTPTRSMTTPVPTMSRDMGYERMPNQSAGMGQAQSQGDAGMAGVGRRQFGADQAGMKPFAQPPRPHTPPHAYFSNPPSLPNVPAQNQSQPYFIASHTESYSYSQSREQDRLGGSLRPGQGNAQMHQAPSSRSASPSNGVGQIMTPGFGSGTYGQAPPGELASRNPSMANVPESADSRSSRGVQGESANGHPRPMMSPSQYEQNQRAEQNHRERPSAGEALRVDTRVAAAGAEGLRNRGVHLKESYAPGAKVSPVRPQFRTDSSHQEPPKDVAAPAGSWKASANALLGRKSSTDASQATGVVELAQRVAIPKPASQPQPVPSASGGNKLPFFERYRQMTDSSNPGGLIRSMSNSSFNKPVDLARKLSDDGGIMPIVFDDLEEEVDSPVAARLEVDEELSSLPWARQSMSKQQESRPIVSERRAREARPNKSDDGSTSSLDQATADKMNVGQMALLTPSTSMDELEDRLHGGSHSRKKSSTPPPRDTLDARRQDNYDEGFLSPNASYPGSRRGSDKQYRDSSASSLLAPSDSISTPGASPFPALDPMKRALMGDRPAGNGKPGRACQKCGDSLKGKRYIESDGIRLCERDWKEIYLPKCRRCKLPIETSAVSSSDGQLRGKWHRQCFTCSQCDQPFDGEAFYVHGDKPYCQLHYHQANGTICASTSCQRPIEGPCLLTSANQRYHPGHLRCSHRGSSANGNQRCPDPMNDYFEIGRLKVCERHKEEALRMASKSGKPTTKAEKRKTRLIDA